MSKWDCLEIFKNFQKRLAKNVQKYPIMAKNIQNGLPKNILIDFLKMPLVDCLKMSKNAIKISKRE